MTPTRCPACAARVRPDDVWCGQCHTDLRPAPVRTAATAGAPSPGPDSGPGADLDDGGRRPGRRAAGPPDDGPVRPATSQEVEALALEWAERLAASETGAGLPGFVARTGTRSGRGVLAVAGGVALVAAFLLTMTVLGAFL